MTDHETATEYAIEVPGRGFAVRQPWGVVVSDEAPYSSDLMHTMNELNSIKVTYEKAGCPEIAETVRLVSRTVTVTRSAWHVPVAMLKREEATP